MPPTKFLYTGNRADQSGWCYSREAADVPKISRLRCAPLEMTLFPTCICDFANC
jgi:hypothetical protein